MAITPRIGSKLTTFLDLPHVLRARAQVRVQFAHQDFAAGDIGMRDRNLREASRLEQQAVQLEGLHGRTTN